MAKKQTNADDCCQKSSKTVTDDSIIYHSTFPKLIIFIVLLGAIPCGIAIYWEVAISFSYFPHLSYQLMFLLAIGLSGILTAMLLPHVGRRHPLIYSTLNFYPALILNALYQGHHVIDLVTRLFAGVAIGAYLTSAIVYVGEIPLPLYRGRYYALLALGFWLGGGLYIILYFIHPLVSLAILIFPLLFFILGLIYLPATPFYVKQIGHDEYSSEVLYFLRCGSLELQKVELENVRKFITESDCYHYRWGMLDRMLTMFLLVTFTHLNGFFLFSLAGGNIVYYITWIIVFVSSLIGFLIYYWIVELVSRLMVFLISVLVTLLGYCLLCGYLAMGGGLIILLYIAIGVFYLGYFLGFACMFFLLAGEIFPYKVKHVCVSFAVWGYFVAFSFCGFLTREFCLALGPFLALVYFIVQNLMALFFCIFIMPRYKNVNLLEIRAYFDGDEL